MRLNSLCLFAGIGALVVGICAPSGQAQALNLITNGGFETGDFTGWTADANSYSMYIVTSPVNSGTYAAQIAGFDFDPNTLSQTVADTSGQSYLLSFWRFQDSGGPTGLDVTWNGTNVFHEVYGTDYLGSPYTEFTAIVFGTGSDSLIFSSFQNPAFTYLDDVSLTATSATPLPSTWTMLIAGFLGLGFFACRGAKKNTSALAAA
jgi:hypothetical protein